MIGLLVSDCRWFKLLESTHPLGSAGFSEEVAGDFMALIPSVVTEKQALRKSIRQANKKRTIKIRTLCILILSAFPQ